MKIEKMTKKALVAVMEEEAFGRKFTDGKEIIREPGTIGIVKTQAGNYMVYMVDENGKLFNTSVHKNRQAANGMVLRRLRVERDSENVMAEAV